MATRQTENRRGGILPSQEIERLIRQRRLAADEPIDDAQVQPATLDLRLGTSGQRLRASFLAGRRDNGGSFAERLAHLAMHPIDLTAPGAVLTCGCVYLIRLQERLDLPADVRGKVNPKSSTGRLDVFTRTVTADGTAFDTVPHGYEGPLYAEVMPRTFSVEVAHGTSLSQLRLLRDDAELDDAALRAVAAETPLIHGRNGERTTEIADGLRLSVDLTADPGGRPIGWHGKKNAPLIRTTGRHDPRDYWNAIRPGTDGELILHPEEIYLLATEQQVRIPPDYAAELVPYDSACGEMRVHYAGFFDPGFGYGADGEVPGARAVLEVRAHDAPFAIRHGQPVGRLRYSRMSARPERIYGVGAGSHYQGQGLALSKHFTAPADER